MTSILCNGVRVGYVEGSVFHKTIQGSRHMLRTPRAIAFDLSTLRDAAHAGATSARVVDSDTGDVYTSSLKRVSEHGAALSRGFGRQWFLALEYWSINGATPKFDARGAATHAKPNSEQLGMFAEGARYD